MIRPDNILLQPNRKCKIGGMVKNEHKPSSALSKNLLNDMKSIGIDYIITCYTEESSVSSNFDSLLKTLGNAEEIGMEIIPSYRVFMKNRKSDYPSKYWKYPEYLDLDKIEEAKKYSSFVGLFHDEPGNDDEVFERIEKFYEVYKDLKMDLNLLPNYAFTDLETFDDYVEKYVKISDTIGVDFYPIIVENANYVVPKSRIRTWAPCLNTLLQKHHKYPEKDYRIFIQTSAHSCYGQLTPITLSMQVYTSLIGGASDVRYFCLTDNDPVNSTFFNSSPYLSDCHGFDHGATYNIVKEFNNGKFKEIKDFITSKYIDKIDYFVNNKSKFDIISNIKEFISSASGEMMASIGYDYEAAYCFIVNTSFSVLTIYPKDGEAVDIQPGDIHILKQNYTKPKESCFKKIFTKIKQFLKKKLKT